MILGNRCGANKINPSEVSKGEYQGYKTIWEAYKDTAT